jgi:hypothetical protein
MSLQTQEVNSEPKEHYNETNISVLPMWLVISLFHRLVVRKERIVGANGREFPDAYMKEFKTTFATLNTVKLR